MNFQLDPPLPTIKVLVVNPLSPTAQLIIVKILSGRVFGDNQLIDLILLVYSNEKPLAEALEAELFGCAFPCYNSITVSSDLPSYSDADVFCFITNFVNPNTMNFEKIDSDDQFDALYLIIKIAHNLSGPTRPEKPVEEVEPKKKTKKPVMKPKKPLIMTDGVIAMDILKSISKNLPPDILFCPTSIAAAARNVLGEYLKVDSSLINYMHIWAANDEVFHIEVEKPLLVNDVDIGYDKEVMGIKQMERFNFDHTQMSASWMKKEFIEKVSTFSSKNPYGCIFKAAEFSKTLQILWEARIVEKECNVRCNVGVISDGSLETLKGYPYILPLVMSGVTWSVDKTFIRDTYLIGEIKRINKAVKEHHDKLIPYCKKFLEENVIKQMFVLVDDVSSELYYEEESSRLGLEYKK